MILNRRRDDRKAREKRLQEIQFKNTPHANRWRRVIRLMFSFENFLDHRIS